MNKKSLKFTYALRVPRRCLSVSGSKDVTQSRRSPRSSAACLTRGPSCFRQIVCQTGAPTTKGNIDWISRGLVTLANMSLAHIDIGYIGFRVTYRWDTSAPHQRKTWPIYSSFLLGRRVWECVTASPCVAAPCDKTRRLEILLSLCGFSKALGITDRATWFRLKQLSTAGGTQRTFHRLMQDLKTGKWWEIMEHWL